MQQNMYMVAESQMVAACVSYSLYVLYNVHNNRPLRSYILLRVCPFGPNMTCTAVLCREGTGMRPSISHFSTRWQLHSVYTRQMLLPTCCMHRPDTNGCRAQHCLLCQGNCAMCMQGWAPLMFACYKGHLPVTQYLIDQGADVSAQTQVSS